MYHSADAARCWSAVGVATEVDHWAAIEPRYVVSYLIAVLALARTLVLTDCSGFVLAVQAVQGVVTDCNRLSYAAGRCNCPSAPGVRLVHGCFAEAVTLESRW